MDWNPYSAPLTIEEEKSKARVRLIIHCIGLLLLSSAFWIWLAVFEQQGMPLGGFFFGAVIGLIFWLWIKDEKLHIVFMFSGSLIVGIAGFIWLASAKTTNAIVDDIVHNPLMLLMLLFGFSMLAVLSTCALILILWLWNFVAKAIRWIACSIP